jgi:hypothetical protein
MIWRSRVRVRASDRRAGQEGDSGKGVVDRFPIERDDQQRTSLFPSLCIQNVRETHQGIVRRSVGAPKARMLRPPESDVALNPWTEFATGVRHGISRPILEMCGLRTTAQDRRSSPSQLYCTGYAPYLARPLSIRFRNLMRAIIHQPRSARNASQLGVSWRSWRGFRPRPPNRSRNRCRALQSLPFTIPTGHWSYDAASLLVLPSM